MGDVWRFEVHLRSKEALVGLMAVQGLSIRKLAALCDPKQPDRYRSAIGHLASGARDTCSPELARQIQKILAPNNAKAQLFDGEVYSVTHDDRTSRRAA